MLSVARGTLVAFKERPLPKNPRTRISTPLISQGRLFSLWMGMETHCMAKLTLGGGGGDLPGHMLLIQFQVTDSVYSVHIHWRLSRCHPQLSHCKSNNACLQPRLNTPPSYYLTGSPWCFTTLTNSPALIQPSVHTVEV